MLFRYLKCEFRSKPASICKTKQKSYVFPPTINTLCDCMCVSVFNSLVTASLNCGSLLLRVIHINILRDAVSPDAIWCTGTHSLRCSRCVHHKPCSAFIVVYSFALYSLLVYSVCWFQVLSVGCGEFFSSLFWLLLLFSCSLCLFLSIFLLSFHSILSNV